MGLASLDLVDVGASDQSVLPVVLALFNPIDCCLPKCLAANAVLEFANRVRVLVQVPRYSAESEDADLPTDVECVGRRELCACERQTAGCATGWAVGDHGQTG